MKSRPMKSTPMKSTPMKSRPSESIPTVLRYMSATPYFIDGNQALTEALQVMKSHSIRHLPVLRQGQIQGIVSDRDLELARSLNGAKASKTKVSDIANTEVFLVRPDARLDEVARLMAKNKLSCVLVVESHKLVGIFTTIDALHALEATLMSRHKKKQEARNA